MRCDAMWLGMGQGGERVGGRGLLYRPVLRRRGCGSRRAAGIAQQVAPGAARLSHRALQQLWSVNNDLVLAQPPRPAARHLRPPPVRTSARMIRRSALDMLWSVSLSTNSQ